MANPEEKKAPDAEFQKISCSKCGTFMFKTYTNPARVEVRCKVCKTNVEVTVEGGKVSYEILNGA